MGARRTPLRAIKTKKSKVKKVTRPWNKPKAKTVLTKIKKSGPKKKPGRGLSIKSRVISRKAGERRTKRYNKKMKK